MSEQKSIKYFCAHYCPFSNETSKSYNLINILFKEKYPDVNVEIYWSEDINEENKNEFLNAKAQYVPTVTNGNYAHISLELPDDYDKEEKTNEELINALLENVYNQLDKEPPTEPEVEPLVEPTNEESKGEFLNMDKIEPKKTLFNPFSKNNKIIAALIILFMIFLISLPFIKKRFKK